MGYIYDNRCVLLEILKITDIIITGRQAIDGDTAQVGPQIAEHLGIPVISYAEGIEVDGD